jgi:hypothetical protein
MRKPDDRLGGYVAEPGSYAVSKPIRRADSERGPLHHELAAAFVAACGPSRWRLGTSYV